MWILVSISLQDVRGDRGFQTCIVRVTDGDLPRGVGKVSLWVIEGGWQEDEAMSFENEFWSTVEKFIEDALGADRSKKSPRGRKK